MGGKMAADRTIPLPQPRRESPVPLEHAIANRRSERRLEGEPLTREEIGQLAWSAQGITGKDARWRSAPSAGALHPLTLYVLIHENAYRYDPVPHALQLHADVNRAELAAAALNQDFIATAPCVFVLAADVSRTARVYKQRGREFVCLDVGHAAQNLLLQATALELGAVPVAVFDQTRVHAGLNLPNDQEPLYLIPVGRSGA
jgi:SagB-type dehydrogenase family enzyme